MIEDSFNTGNQRLLHLNGNFRHGKRHLRRVHDLPCAGVFIEHTLEGSEQLPVTTQLRLDRFIGVLGFQLFNFLEGLGLFLIRQ